MNRQYIGARYVPRFSSINNGVWDNTYSYEALEIVKHGNDYYTSKKPVPVGVAITNTEYWVKTGDYNGAISGLDTRVSTLETKMDDVEDNLDYVTTKTSRLSNRKIMLMGDSYALTGQPYTSWHTLFEQLTNTECVKYANNGGGFVASGQLGTFKQIFDKAPLVEGLTDIIVCGGANDNTAHNAGNTASAVTNAIVAFASSVYTKYPNVNLHIGFIGGSKDATYITPLAVARNAYRDGANLAGANFIDASDALKLSDVMYDYLHPTTAGMNIIVQYIIAGVLGNIYHTYRTAVSCPLTAKTGVSFDSANMSHYYNQYDKNIEFKLDGIVVFDFSTPIKLVHTSYTQLATLDVLTESLAKLDGNVSGIVVAGGSTTSGVGLSFRVINDALYVKSMTQYTSVTRILTANVSMLGII